MDEARRVWYLHECGGKQFVDRQETLDSLFGDCKTSVLCIQTRDAEGTWTLDSSDVAGDASWNAAMSAMESEGS